MHKLTIKKIKLAILVGTALVFGYCWRVLLDPGARAAELQDFNKEVKNITIVEDGMVVPVISQANTVGEALEQQKVVVGENDDIFPSLQSAIFSDSKIIINHARKVSITDGSKKYDIITTRKTVEAAIWDQKNIALNDDDYTIPTRTSLVTEGMKVVITHVIIKEEVIEKPIDFKVVVNEDDSLGWRIKKVTQKGVKGINEVKYRVVFHDGKEFSRKILDQNITQQPVDEIVTQGTYVKLGASHTGAASWYAYTGTMSAANPWLPLGSYVKVTNRDNGKSVIVKINDRGPFGNGRIIDLDKVAFAKIADLGAGVANVKMEVITN